MNPFRSIRTLLSSGSDLTSLDLRTSLETPSLSLASPQAFNMVFGGEPTVSGEVVNEDTALAISTVYACVRLIAESVAGIPLKVYKRRPRGREEDVSHTLSYLLSTQPNAEMSAFTFFESLVGCLALTGNCYAWIQRDSSGSPVGLWPLHPMKTTPFRADDGTLAYKTSDGMATGERLIKTADMLHVPLFSWDGLKGLSPIQQARQELGLAVSQLKQGARFFGNGSRPGGLLMAKGTLSADQQKQLRKAWEDQAAGLNQGRVAVLPADLTYQQLGLSLEDSQFLQSRGYSRNAIAALFRIDSHWLGDTTRQSNANHEQSSLSLLQDTLAPYLVKIEQEIMRKLFAPTGRVLSTFFVQFDVTERLRTDFKTTLESLAIGRQWGAYSANDMRQILNMNPIGPEGDIYLAPTNMLDADQFKDWSPQAKQALPAETKE